jgi:hypothetical protein
VFQVRDDDPAPRVGRRCIGHREAKSATMRCCAPMSLVGLEQPICSADCRWTGSGGSTISRKDRTATTSVMAPGRPFFPPEPDIGIGIEPRQDPCSSPQSWGRDREASAALKWGQRLPALSPT